MLNFQSYQPSKELSLYVHSYWTLETHQDAANDEGAFRFIPDGNVEWMFHIESPNAFKFNGQTDFSSSKSHSLAQFQSFLDVKYRGTNSVLFSIKFHPWAAHLFFDGSMKQYNENVVDLCDVRNDDIQRLIDNIHTARNHEERVQFAEAYLLSVLQSHDEKEIVWLSNRIKSLADYNHSQDLDAGTNLSKRRLQQIFATKIGIASKKMERIYRTRKAAEYIMRNPEVSFTDVTYLFNFYDQSHFIQELTHFSGLSPKEFQKHLQHDEDMTNLRLTV